MIRAIIFDRWEFVTFTSNQKKLGKETVYDLGDLLGRNSVLSVTSKTN